MKIEELTKLWKRLKLLVVLCSIIIAGAVFLPNKDTMWKMVAAHYITTNRVEKVIEKTGEIKDILKQDLIDIIREFKDEKTPSRKN
jgi:hypothetical protein